MRLCWLAVVVVGYRSIVDIGAQGSGGYMLHLLAMFAIYAVGYGLAARLSAPRRDPQP